MRYAGAVAHLPAALRPLQAKYNVMEALVYLGPFTCGALAAGAYAFEWDGLRSQVRPAARLCRGDQLPPSRPKSSCLACCMACHRTARAPAFWLQLPAR